MPQGAPCGDRIRLTFLGISRTLSAFTSQSGQP